MRSAEFVATRDSVAMGDDVWAPHRRTIRLTVPVTVARLLRSTRRGYLANIAGGDATWVVRVRAAEDDTTGAPVAVVAQQWRRPRYLLRPGTALEPGQRFVHYHYLQQQDPELVYAALAASLDMG